MATQANNEAVIDEVIENINESKMLRIVLIGKTGNGKSSTSNTLMGDENTFKEGFGFGSVTSTSQMEKVSRCNRNVTVIDTPGICDTGKDATAIYRQMAKGMILAKPGPHVFGIVVKIDRFTSEDEQVVETVKKFFGENMLNFAIVVFTMGDEIKRAGADFEKVLEQAPDALRKLVDDCRNRYFLIDNRAENRKDEGAHLVNYALANGLGTAYCKDPHNLTEMLKLEAAKKQREMGFVGTDDELATKAAEEDDIPLSSALLDIMKSLIPMAVKAGQMVAKKAKEGCNIM